jgi:hypothetical protein
MTKLDKKLLTAVRSLSEKLRDVETPTLGDVSLNQRLAENVERARQALDDTAANMGLLLEASPRKKQKAVKALDSTELEFLALELERLACEARDGKQPDSQSHELEQMYKRTTVPSFKEASRRLTQAAKLPASKPAARAAIMNHLRIAYEGGVTKRGER